MKRVLIYAICAVFLLVSSGSVIAVEKKEKKQPAKAKITLKKSDTVKRTVSQPRKQAPPKPKKYDSFIDKNNNGIDDRKERLVPKPKPAKQDSKKKKKDKDTEEK